MAFVKTIAHFLVFSARFCDKAQAELARSKARAMDSGLLALTRAGATGVVPARRDSWYRGLCRGPWSAAALLPLSVAYLNCVKLKSGRDRFWTTHRRLATKSRH